MTELLGLKVELVDNRIGFDGISEINQAITGGGVAATLASLLRGDGGGRI